MPKGSQGFSPKPLGVTQEVLATAGLRAMQGRGFVGLFLSEMPNMGFCRGEDACDGILLLK